MSTVIIDTDQITLTELKEQSIDLFIASCGYETRGIYTAGMLNLDKVEFKYCMFFPETNKHNWRNNKDFFFEHGFQPMSQIFNTAYENVEMNLSTILNYFNKEEITILVDYSSMTKEWYGGLLYYFKYFLSNSANSKLKRIEVLFSYTPALFSESEQFNRNDYIGPIEGFTTISPSSLLPFMIIGLGFEAERVIGLIEFLQLSYNDVLLFYTSGDFSNSEDKKYLEKAQENLKDFLSMFDPEKIVLYDVSNINKTLHQLGSIIQSQLPKGKRLIIAPLGPKPFALCSMITALKYGDMNVYRVTEGQRSDVRYDRLPNTSKEQIICKIVYEQVAVS